MKTTSVVLVLDKVVKHSVRYSTPPEAVTPFTVYVPKTWLGLPFPQSIRINIEEEGAQ